MVKYIDMFIGERLRQIVVEKFPSLRTQADAEKWQSESIQLEERRLLSLEHYYDGEWVEREQDSSAGRSWQSRVNYGPRDTTYLIVSQDQTSPESASKHIILANPNIRGIKMKISLGPKTELAEMDIAEEQARIEYRRNVDLNAPINPPPPIRMRKVDATLFDLQNLGVAADEANLPKLQVGVWDTETLNNQSGALSSKIEVGGTAKLVFGDWSIVLAGDHNNRLQLSYGKNEE